MVLAPAPFATATLQAEALKGNAGPASNGIVDSACMRRSLRIRFQEHDGIKWVCTWYLFYLRRTYSLSSRTLQGMETYPKLPYGMIGYTLQ